VLGDQLIVQWFATSLRADIHLHPQAELADFYDVPEVFGNGVLLSSNAAVLVT
jgi:hypothetical protein